MLTLGIWLVAVCVCIYSMDQRQQKCLLIMNCALRDHVSEVSRFLDQMTSLRATEQQTVRVVWRVWGGGREWGVRCVLSGWAMNAAIDWTQDAKFTAIDFHPGRKAENRVGVCLARNLIVMIICQSKRLWLELSVTVACMGQAKLGSSAARGDEVGCIVMLYGWPAVRSNDNKILVDDLTALP